MSKNPHDRLLELDALRGLAAISVVFFHYTFQYTEVFHPSQATLFQFPLGRYGVQLFFIISGYVIFMTLEKTSSPLDFIVSRFSRLYPCYWAAMLLTFSVVRIYPLPGYEVSFKQAFFNLTMLHKWFNVASVDNVYWTLTVELSFYFLIFVVFLTRGMKYIEALGFLLLTLMVINKSYLTIFHLHIPNIITVSEFLIYGHLFFAGILFYNLKTKGHKWYRYFGLGACLLVQHLLRDKPYVTLVVVVWFLFFYLFILNRLSWLAHKPLLYLGTISYSLYLVHQVIGYVIIRHLTDINANALLKIVIPIGCSLLLATLLTFGVEKPMMEHIRRAYKLMRGCN